MHVAYFCLFSFEPGDGTTTHCHEEWCNNNLKAASKPHGILQCDIGKHKTAALPGELICSACAQCLDVSLKKKMMEIIQNHYNRKLDNRMDKSLAFLM